MPVDRDVEVVTDKIAAWVKRARLETPFLFFLESHRPLARLLGHGLNIFEPAAVGLMGVERVDALRRILFDPDAFNHLISRLTRETDTDGDSSGK